MANLGLLAFTLAAVRNRFGLDISLIAAFTCVAGSKLYSFMRPLSTPTKVLLESDIAPLPGLNSLLTFTPKVVLVLQLQVGSHVSFRP